MYDENKLKLQFFILYSKILLKGTKRGGWNYQRLEVHNTIFFLCIFLTFFFLKKPHPMYVFFLVRVFLFWGCTIFCFSVIVFKTIN